MKNIVKRYYDKGIYDKDDVKVFVRAGKITEAEYEEITKERILLIKSVHQTIKNALDLIGVIPPEKM